MDAEARASLADQLLSNPLFDELMDGVEAAAIEQMVAAKDHEKRHEGALRVQVVRTFREDCQRELRNTRPKKAAPA